MPEKLYGLGAVVRLVDRISGPASRVSRAFNDLLGKAKALDAAGRMQQFGNRMLLQATLLNQAAGSMKGGFDKAIASFTGIEDAATAFKTVATPVAGSVANAYQLGVDRAIAFSRENVQSAATYLRSSYQMASAGLQTEAALYGTETAMKVATATMGDEVEAALLLATTYKNLGNVNADVQGEMIRLGDVLTVTQQKFLFPSLQPLIDGMKKASAPAKTMRVSLEQLMPILGMLNTLNIRGEEAGTALRQTLMQLVPASRKLGIQLRYTTAGNLDLIGFLEDLRRKYGLLSEASADVQFKVSQAFGGVRGAMMIMALGGQEEMLRQYQREMQKSAGVTEATAATMQSTFSASLKILRNNITALFYQIGLAIAPTLKAIAGVVRVVTQHVQEFVARYPLVAKIAGAFLGLMAAISAIVVPVIFLVGSLSLLAGAAVPVLVAIGGFILSAAPFIAAAIAMGIVAYEIYKNWDSIVGRLKAIWEGLVHGISWLATQFWEGGKQLVLSLWEGIKSLAFMPYNAVKDMLDRIRKLLPFSPAKEGPLKDLAAAGQSIPMMLAKGIEARGPDVKRSVTDVLKDAFAPLPSATFVAPMRPYIRGLRPYSPAEGMLAAQFPAPEPFLILSQGGSLSNIRWGKKEEPLSKINGGDGAALGEFGVAPGHTYRIYNITQHFERDSIRIQAGSLDAETLKEELIGTFTKRIEGKD